MVRRLEQFLRQTNVFEGLVRDLRVVELYDTPSDVEVRVGFFIHEALVVQCGEKLYKSLVVSSRIIDQVDAEIRNESCFPKPMSSYQPVRQEVHSGRRFRFDLDFIEKCLLS